MHARSATAAVLFLSSLAAFAQYPGREDVANPRLKLDRDIIRAKSQNYALLPPHRIADNVVAFWSDASGRFILGESVKRPDTKKDLFEDLSVRPDKETRQFFSYDLQRKRYLPIGTPYQGDGPKSVGTFGSKGSFLIVMSSTKTDQEIYYVNAETGSVKSLQLPDLHKNPSTQKFDVQGWPNLPYALISISDIQNGSTHFYRFDEKTAAAVPLPEFDSLAARSYTVAPWWPFDQKGIVVQKPQEEGEKSAFIRKDPFTGAETPWKISLEEGSHLKFEVVLSRADGGKPPLQYATVQATAEDATMPAVVALQVERGSVTPDNKYVLYTIEGELKEREIIPITENDLKILENQEIKDAAMKKAAQASKAIQFMLKNNIPLPVTKEAFTKEFLMGPLAEGLEYTPKSPGELKLANDLSKVEILNYRVESAHGRAAVFADGSVRWVTDDT